MLRYLTIATAASLPSYSSAFASPAGTHSFPLRNDLYSAGTRIHEEHPRVALRCWLFALHFVKSQVSSLQQAFAWITSSRQG